jgi:hypothetical protein
MRRLREKPIKPLERFLIVLDSGQWSAISRVGFGLAIPPVFRALSGGHDSLWTFLAFFIGLLVALRVVPAVLRLALPFSAEAKAIWAERRFLAKRYDSYQWQKLFWIGLGLLPHVVAAGAVRNGELVVAIVSLIGGSLGLLLWRKVNATRSAP